MSIHHEVTVHCDTCGFWEPGDAQSTKQRRKLGWRIWQQLGPYGGLHWRHACPQCAPTVRPQGDRQVVDIPDE